ncbi:phosphotransferase enzyme family protein [Paenibacillus terrigena]|uniref:phosphotransferase enzyme family protein n=1 Tax=Paenibacillus terrigena TaxID=369333 RepID=UPI00036F8022|nr:phosphotransferase [Paenibacillus terrigena]
MISDTIKNQVFAQLGCQSSDAKLLGGYNSNVFEVNIGVDIVVKILDRSVTAVTSLLSEIEWLEYIHAHGLNVVKPLRLYADKYIHHISDDFYFVIFEKVNGVHVGPQDNKVWNKKLFEKWGETMGRVHSLAKSYRAKNERPHWFQNNLFYEAAQPKIILD